MPSFRASTWRRITLAAAFVWAGSAALAQDRPAGDEADHRRYDAGPLTPADFQAEVPEPLPTLGRFRQLGFVDTDIRFQMKYTYRRHGDGFEARLQDIDVYAVFLPQNSWLSVDGKQAVDHEQGHFDITQIYALQAKLNMKRQLDEGKTLVGRGEDTAAAVADLERQIRDWLKPVYDRAATAQQEYDRNTRNGTRPAAQAAHRKRHLEVLEQLIADLSSDESEAE